MVIQSRANIAQIPVIASSPLLSGHQQDAVVAQIRQACCETGFFYVVRHRIDVALQQRLEHLSRHFAQDLETKQ